MKNERTANIMHKQLKQLKAWNRRKIVLLFVLFFSAMLIAASFYHFASVSYMLEKLHKNQQATSIITSKVKDIWAYSGSGTAVLLIAGVIYFLLWEIRQRRKINDELLLQKEYYRITLDGITEGLITTDKNGEILHMNPAAEKLTGWNLKDAVGLPLETVYKVTNESTGKPVEHIVKRMLKTGVIVEFENNTLLQTKNSNNLVISNCGSLIMDKKGSIAGTVLLFSDITQKKKTEDSLKQNRDFLQKTMDVSLDIICTLDEFGHFVTMNAAVEKIWGFKPGELIGNSFTDYIAKEDIQKTIEIAGAIVRGLTVNNFENNYKHKNGALVPMQWSSYWDKESKLIFAVARDMTERKKYENKLKASDAFSRGILDSLSSHIAVINAEGTIVKTNTPWINFAVSNGMTNLAKCTEGANYFAGCSKDESYQDAFADESIEGIKKVINGSLPEFYLEYPCSYGDQQKWFFMRAMKFESDETLFLIEHHDITERKNAEEQTLAAIERYEILAKASSDTIWDWNFVENKILYNSGITTMFGYSRSDVGDVFNWWKQKIHPEDLNYVTDAYRGVVKDQQQNIQLEYRFLCADGTYKYIYDRAFVVYDASNKPVRMIGAMQDVSYEKEEEKRINKAIIDTQERERNQIGLELHDNVNQILVCSLLNLGMAGRAVDPKALLLIEKSKNYINDAIAEIRKLSHRLAPATFEDISLEEIFEGVIRSVNVGKQFTYKMNFKDFKDQTISADIQINLLRIFQEQLNNIVKYSGATVVDVSVKHQPQSVTMRIADNGIGFNLSTVKRGIGLANIKKRTEALKGKYTLNSSPGNGCEIILEIPVGKRGTP